MIDANEYTLLAEKSLKLAETVRDAHEKRALLEIAWAFVRLACATIVPERGETQSKLH